MALLTDLAICPTFDQAKKKRYQVSSYSFCGNYSFLDLEIQRSQYINVQRLFKGGNYHSRALKSRNWVKSRTFLFFITSKFKFIYCDLWKKSTDFSYESRLSSKCAAMVNGVLFMPSHHLSPILMRMNLWTFVNCDFVNSEIFLTKLPGIQIMKIGLIDGVGWMSLRADTILCSRRAPANKRKLCQRMDESQPIWLSFCPRNGHI